MFDWTVWRSHADLFQCGRTANTLQAARVVFGGLSRYPAISDVGLQAAIKEAVASLIAQTRQSQLCQCRGFAKCHFYGEGYRRTDFLFRTEALALDADAHRIGEQKYQPDGPIAPG